MLNVETKNIIRGKWGSFLRQLISKFKYSNNSKIRNVPLQLLREGYLPACMRVYKT